MDTSADSPEVRGTAFLGILKQLKQRSSSSGDRFERFAQTLQSNTPVLSQRIRKTAWYPYDGFVALLVAADAEYGRGDLDLCRVLGSGSAKLDLGTVFRIFASLASPEHLIKACGRVWGRYYRNAGVMKATAWSPEKTTLEISGFAGMHPGHCRLMEGWMISAMKIIGAEVGPEARETRCCSRGDDVHEFCATWTRRAGARTSTSMMAAMD